jgi:hypothetical protein
VPEAFTARYQHAKTADRLNDKAFEFSKVKNELLNEIIFIDKKSIMHNNMCMMHNFRYGFIETAKGVGTGLQLRYRFR